MQLLKDHKRSNCREKAMTGKAQHQNSCALVRRMTTFVRPSIRLLGLAVYMSSPWALLDMDVPHIVRCSDIFVTQAPVLASPTCTPRPFSATPRRHSCPHTLLCSQIPNQYSHTRVKPCHVK